MPWNIRFGFGMTAPIFVILSMTGRGGAEAQDGSNPDVASIRSELKQSWDSLQTIQFQFDEYGVDEKGQRTTPYGLRVNFAHAGGGRWAYSAKSTLGDVVKQFGADIRENGKRQWSVSPFPENPEVVSNILIRSQSDDERTYSLGMQTLLWLWIPGGKPPIAYLDAGGKFEVTKVDGKVHASIKATYNETPIGIDLDPDHDWLPSRVAVDDFLVYEATKFRRDNGRWFYERGIELRHHGKLSGPEAGEIVPGIEGDSRREFIVTALSVNRTLGASTFEDPRSEPGVLIQDQTTGKDVMVGGYSAYQGRQRRYGASSSTERVANPIEAPVDPPGDFWGLATMIAASAALLTAGFLMIRKARR